MIDAGRNELRLEISATELDARKKAWKPRPPLKETGCLLAKPASHVESASKGAAADQNR